MKLFEPPSAAEQAVLTAPYAGRTLDTKLRALGWETVADEDHIEFLPKLGAPHTSVDLEGERWVFGRHPRFGRGIMLARRQDVAVLVAVLERVDGIWKALGGVDAFMKHVDNLPDLTLEQRAALDGVARMGNRLSLLEYLASLVEGEHDTKS